MPRKLTRRQIGQHQVGFASAGVFRLGGRRTRGEREEQKSAIAAIVLWQRLPPFSDGRGDCYAVDGPSYLAEPKRLNNRSASSESILTPRKKTHESCAVTYPPKFSVINTGFQKNAEERPARGPGKMSREAYHQVMRLSSDCYREKRGQIATREKRTPETERSRFCLRELVDGIGCLSYSVGISILSSPSGCCRFWSPGRGPRHGAADAA